MTPKEYGAICDGTTDDRVSIQNAINATPVGGVLSFPATQCAVSQNGANLYTLVINNPIQLVCQQGGGIKPLASVGNTVNTLYFNGAASGVYAQTIVDGCFIGDNSVGTRHGNHAIVFDTQTAGRYFARPVVRNSYLQQSAGTGSGIFHVNNATNNVNGGLYAAIFTGNYIGGGVHLSLSGDSIWITNNILTGINAGVYANLVSGAGNLYVGANNCTNAAGCAVIDRAASYQIIGNLFEQTVTNTESNNSIVDLRGTTSTLGQGVVSANQIQANAGTGSPILIRVGAATGAVIDNNAIATPTAYVPVIITASASATVIGSGNTFSGVSANFTDSGSNTIYMPLSKGAATSLIGNSTGSKAQATDIAIGNHLSIAAGPQLNVTTGTSGAAIPLLNGTNTWSGTQGFANGSFVLNGLTSGTLTQKAAAIAGTNTITWPAGTTDFSATGGTSRVIKQTSAGGAFTVAQLACSDLSDSGSGCAGSSAIVVGSTVISSGTSTRILYDNAGVVGEYTLSGSGTAVAMATAPTIAGGSLTGLTTFALRDTSAAFDVTIAATSAAALTAGRTLTIGMDNVAHTLKLGTIANTITFPNAASYTVSGLALALGGTNAALTASNGGVVYSDASAFAILSGTATARQMLQSGASAAPAWSTTTWPATTTINRLLYSSAANVISDLATANGGVLNTSATGVPSITATPVLGLAGTTLGSLGFSGNTSGVVTVQPAAAAGTWTFTWPTSGGTNGQVLGTNGSGAASWISHRQYISGSSLGTDVSAGTTVYMSHGAPNATEAAVAWVASVAGSYKNLVAYTGGAPGVGKNYTMTFRNGLAATTLTCTISGNASNSCSDTTHTVSAAAGDRFDLQIVSDAGSNTSGTVIWAVEFDSP